MKAINLLYQQYLPSLISKLEFNPHIFLDSAGSLHLCDPTGGYPTVGTEEDDSRALRHHGLGVVEGHAAVVALGRDVRDAGVVDL